MAESDNQRRFVAFDGKVLRGSFDHFKDQKAVQVLSAFLTDSRIILAHEEIAEKTNEIPTAQELIAKLGLSGYIFTFDALDCQEKTLKAARETGNDVVVQVKENQKTLYNDCKTTAETMSPDKVYREPTTKARNRIESRQVEVFTTPNITDAEKWSLVDAIVKVERNRLVFDTKTKCWQRSDETLFYVSTVMSSAQEFCEGIRNHWGIENRNHQRCNYGGRQVSHQNQPPHLRQTLKLCPQHPSCQQCGKRESGVVRQLHEFQQRPELRWREVELNSPEALRTLGDVCRAVKRKVLRALVEWLYGIFQARQNPQVACALLGV